MIQIRKSKERGHAQHGWLESYHTFSFADYYDSKFMEFRSLRVINEDWVKSGEGFGEHPHRDMEIITYVIDGELAHKDSMGTGSVIRPGEIQMMSAGSGVTHSEFNHFKKDAVHLLQIWIFPDQKNLKPSYQQKSFDLKKNKGKLQLLVSSDAENDSLKIHQNVRLFTALLEGKEVISYDFSKGRYGWIQVVRGSLQINNQKLSAGDGAAISEEKAIELKTPDSSEFLLFDLN